MPNPLPRMRSSSLLVTSSVLALVFLLAACGSGGDPPPDPGDAPTVESTTPDDEATGVSIGSAIVVEFSEAMDTASVEDAFATSPDVSCSFSWNGDDTRLTCDPDADLDANTTYSVTIAADAEAADGASLDSELTFEFTTGDEVTEQCTFGESEFGACRFAS